jgi:hypothetical protein
MMKARRPSEGGASAQADAQRQTFNQLLNTALSVYTGGLYSSNPDAVRLANPAPIPGQREVMGRLVPLQQNQYDALMGIFR